MPEPEADRDSRTRRARIWLVAGAALAIALAILVWRFTPLTDLVTPRRLAGWFESVRASPWAPVIVIGVYVVSGFVVFPLTLLIAATALVFDAPIAFALSMVGSLANAAALYAFGARFVRGPLRDAFGPAVDRVARSLEDRGMVAVAVLRTIPVAPFTVVNLAAGSLHVPFLDYLIGTAIGLLPGLTLITAFGHQLREVFEEPTAAKIAAVLALVVIWIALSFLLQRVTSRRRKKA